MGNRKPPQEKPPHVKAKAIRKAAWGPPFVRHAWGIESCHKKTPLLDKATDFREAGMENRKPPQENAAP
jgi:hypothetical protein